MSQKKEKEMSKQKNVVRTSDGLRCALFEEMDALRSGTSNPQRAAAMSKLAVQIINTVRMEVDYQRHVTSNPSAFEGMKTTPLKLGA